MTIPELTSAEALELLSIYEASIDVQFQVWLTVTFAVIVAGFASRGNLPRNMVHLMAFLYLITCTAIAARWAVEISRVVQLAAQNPVVDDFLPAYSIAPMIRIGTCVLGTLTASYTLYFFQRPGRSR